MTSDFFERRIMNKRIINRSPQAMLDSVADGLWKNRNMFKSIIWPIAIVI